MRCPAHKMLAPMGSGALIAKPALLEAMPPYHGGGEMIERVWDDHSTWNKVPHKFEGGTADVEAAVGSARRSAYLEQLGLDNVSAHEQELARLTIERLSPDRGCHGLWTLREHRAVRRAVHLTATFIPHDLATILDTDGVCHSRRPSLHAAAHAPARRPPRSAACVLLYL